MTLSLSPEARRVLVQWMLSDDLDPSHPEASAEALDRRFHEALSAPPILLGSAADVVNALIDAAGRSLPIMVANVQYVPVPVPVPDDAVVTPVALRTVLALAKSAYAGEGAEAGLLLLQVPRRDLDGAQLLAESVSDVLSAVRRGPA